MNDADRGASGNGDLAVLDLGSNSFHLQIVRPSAGGELLTIERIKDKVQLLSGIDGDRLADSSMRRAEISLSRLGQRVSCLEPGRIVALGTSALRRASNGERVLEAARQALGVEVEVISGQHEARLIYRGAAHYLANSLQPRLIIDIGGGSTELAIGRGFDLAATASCEVGCVELTDRYFRQSDRIAERFAAARSDAADRLLHTAQSLPVPEAVYGTSGTVESIQSVLVANGWARDAITRTGLDALIQAIEDRRTLVDIGMPGLPPERVDIFPGGVALLAALFDTLKLESVTYLPASLQDGALYAMLETPAESDVQQQAIEGLASRFGVDLVHAERVRRTAWRLHEQIGSAWQVDGLDERRLLGWAASLCELGLSVGVRGFHRHGAYIIANSELRGFSKDQRKSLALLVRSHRRRLPSLAFAEFPVHRAEQLRRLSVLLRLAVILHRSHDDDEPEAYLSGDLSRSELRLPSQWLDAHALSRSELVIEQQVLADVGVMLSVVEQG